MATGQKLAGLDLSGCASAADLLDATSGWLAQHPGKPVYGHSWDETGWSEPQLPSKDDLDRLAPAARQVPIYLGRVDLHSALLNSALADRAHGIVDLAGYAESGLVTQAAHHLARATFQSGLGQSEREGLLTAALTAAVRAGIGSVHENGVPGLTTLPDLSLAGVVGSRLGVEVISYWGELFHTYRAREAPEVVANLRGLAGDLCADGSVGSRTAALHQPYSDQVELRGVAYLDVATMTEHIVNTTEAGWQAGFHCIGDAAVAAVCAAFTAAAERLGVTAMRQARHRVEHVEMITDAELALLAELDITASMQPGFDLAWGGPGGLYEQRLGRRAASMNRCGSAIRRGVRLAFGSDTPVLAMQPWQAIRAASQHQQAAERISVTQALHAHTVGGRQAAADPDALSGTIRVGAPAHLALWQASSDPAWFAADGSPRLGAADQDPTNCATIVAGRLVEYR